MTQYSCLVILLSDKSFSAERRVFYFIGQQYFRNEKIAVTVSCRDAREYLAGGRPLSNQLDDISRDRVL